jgi:hypothetical protein
MKRTSGSGPEGAAEGCGRRVIFKFFQNQLNKSG